MTASQPERTDIAAGPEGERVFGEFRLLEGFHQDERDALGPFVWTRKSFRLGRRRRSDYLALRLCYYGRQGQLRVKDGATVVGQCPLCYGWQWCALDVRGAAGAELSLELSEAIPVPGDDRELGVMIRRIEPLDDRGRYEALAAVAANTALNQREYAEGRTVLRSVPPSLRIDIESRCNIRPPCVYCEWDWAKRREKLCTLRFTERTLEELGPFYALSDEVVDCSQGEPLLHEGFGRLARRFDEDRKLFEVTSNGLLLDAEHRRLLLGRRMAYHVSVDSATAAGYGRYRGDHFDRVIEGLRMLCREKKQAGDLPVVIVPFIAMASNVEEFPAFLDLMKDVGVDAVKLRSLLADPQGESPVVTRGGRRFDYAAEILPTSRLAAAGQAARVEAERRGMKLLVESDFGAEDAVPGAPLCREPWNGMYILRRMLKVCCFTRQPIVEWSQQGRRELAEFLADVWNGPEYRALREGLAKGKLPLSCLQCASCPIVKRAGVES